MLFKDVPGADAVKNRLIQSVHNGKISHAQLFFGPEEAPKLPLALAFAQYLQCENRQQDDACGVCPSCQKHAKLAHPDLHLIFPNCTTDKVKKDPDYKEFSNDFAQLVLKYQGQLTLQEWLDVLGGENKQAAINARDCSHIIHQNHIKSYQGGYKVFIIWQADRLQHQAAPKLLKTLEEPQENTLFILISENTDAILKTILSRLQMVKIPKTLTPNFEEDNPYFELFLEWMRAAYRTRFMNADLQKMDFIATTALIDKITDLSREQQKQFLSYFLKCIEQILLLNENLDNLVYASETTKTSLQKMKQFFNVKIASLFYEELNQAIYHVERNANPNILYTDLLFKTAGFLGV